jgi:hypothetical protein
MSWRPEVRWPAQTIRSRAVRPQPGATRGAGLSGQELVAGGGGQQNMAGGVEPGACESESGVSLAERVLPLHGGGRAVRVIGEQQVHEPRAQASGAQPVDVREAVRVLVERPGPSREVERDAEAALRPSERLLDGGHRRRVGGAEPEPLSISSG